MTENVFWRCVILQCLSIAALLLLEYFDIRVSRGPAFFIFAAAALAIIPINGTMPRAAGILVQIPYMIYLDKQLLLSTTGDSLLYAAFILCNAVTIFLIHLLDLKDGTKFAWSLAAAALYYSFLARVDVHMLIFPSILLNLIFFVVIYRSGRLGNRKS